MVVYFIVFGTYGIFMWAMFKPFQGDQPTGNYTAEDEAGTGEKLFHTLFWRLLTATNEDPVSITKTVSLNGTNGTREWVSYEFSHAVTMFVWAVYQITIAIIMVNLLIAIMNNTFGKIKY